MRYSKYTNSSQKEYSDYLNRHLRRIYPSLWHANIHMPTQRCPLSSYKAFVSIINGFFLFLPYFILAT